MSAVVEDVVVEEEMEPSTGLPPVAPSSTSAARGYSSNVVTSPEVLKNNSVNIRQLEHTIEHCEGRKKYRAFTKSPSDGDDVRWYFCKAPLQVGELSASVPRTEIMGKGQYFRFSMRDSLALEFSFLESEDQLLTYWWKEYAECSEGPIIAQTSNTTHSEELYKIDEERVGVPVKGGLYEVDLLKRHCFPVYWNGENRRVLRGHWFARKGGLDWIPLREDIAEQLESAYCRQVWHRRKFQPSGLYAARVDLQGNSKGLHALFTGEDDTWEAWLVYETGPKFGGSQIRVRRGFLPSGSSKPTQDELRQERQDKLDDYCSQVPVGHVVFMIHGVGQRLEKSNLVDDVKEFRHVTANLAERFLSPYQKSKQRVLFIPCQWRKGLKLSGENAVDKITLPGVHGLRMVLSATIHDILYYMSPFYCQHIIDSVSNQLNRQYMKFLKRNPGYDGKVSLYGHSLGSVLSFDILSHQESLSSPFPIDRMEMEAVTDHGSVVEASDLFVPSGAAFVGSHLIETVDEHSDQAAHKTEASVSGSGSHVTSYSDGTHNGDVPGNSLNLIDGKAFVDDVSPSFDEGKNEVYNVVDQDHQKFSNQNESYVLNPNGINGNATIVGTEPSDIIDKDQAIALMEEEIKNLKARMQELDSSRQVQQEKDAGSATNCSTSSHPLALQTDETYVPHIRYTKLVFEVDTFYAVGSPLGFFLALRNERIGIGKGQDYWQDDDLTEQWPSCRQLLNIFHPYDPVAYRWALVQT